MAESLSSSDGFCGSTQVCALPIDKRGRCVEMVHGEDGAVLGPLFSITDGIFRDFDSGKYTHDQVRQASAAEKDRGWRCRRTGGLKPSSDDGDGRAVPAIVGVCDGGARCPLGNEKLVPVAGTLSWCPCHEVLYCSAKCQRRAWKAGHKRTCSTRKKPEQI